MSDYELIQKCLGGESLYFEQLVTRYKKLIYSVIFNIMRDKDEVADISQNVFIRIYKALNRYNPEYKFSTWAVRITTNLCLDILRKKKPDVVAIENIEEHSDTQDTPENKYLKMEKTTEIRRAIGTLPEKYRVPIILYHQNGMSYEEIAKVLNEPMTIVKNRLYRARLMLRESLKPAGKEGPL